MIELTVLCFWDWLMQGLDGWFSMIALNEVSGFFDGLLVFGIFAFFDFGRCYLPLQQSFPSASLRQHKFNIISPT